MNSAAGLQFLDPNATLSWSPCIPLFWISRRYTIKAGRAHMGDRTTDSSRKAWNRGRIVTYLVAFPSLLWTDALTPIGFDDWLLCLTLLSIAAVWGSRRELRIVLAAACAVLVAGLFTSPVTIAPFWVDALNRSVALLVLWSIAYMANRRRSAEEAERKAIAEVRTLEGLLPMCAGCKSIRDNSGEWHRLETYLTAHSEARLTHSFCPQCATKHMNEVEEPPR
jgi:hypothetical protein